uniref:Serpin B6 n=1 Tax=Oryzias latipes TaxID=8090 RepID=A0A3B3HLP8_ORYLA
MASINPLSKANISFSLAMLRQLSEDHRTTNIFFSPFSISSALAMVMLGARGDTATQMAELERVLTCERFMEWTHPDQMPLTYVKVKVPRFKLEETYNLSNVLTSMGVKDAFNQMTCDFSGMSATKDLFLSEATHKAFVEVNEEGTEAAAATASFMCGKSLCMCCHRVPTFTANRPFLFFFRHNSSMTLLFAGRFFSPGLQL